MPHEVDPGGTALGSSGIQHDVPAVGWAVTPGERHAHTPVPRLGPAARPLGAGVAAWGSGRRAELQPRAPSLGPAGAGGLPRFGGADGPGSPPPASAAAHPGA